jgi:hypothetical protein
MVVSFAEVLEVHGASEISATLSTFAQCKETRSEATSTMNGPKCGATRTLPDDVYNSNENPLKERLHYE